MWVLLNDDRRGRGLPNKLLRRPPQGHQAQALQVPFLPSCMLDCLESTPATTIPRTSPTHWYVSVLYRSILAYQLGDLTRAE